jgi:glycosyltransferase involved in cell wall biosynthesis
MKDLTSVIIPAHNEEQYIRKTIECYLKQDFKKEKIPYELIVVANGCEPNDDTPNIAEDLGAKVIELEEANVSIARNKGVEKSEGEVLVFNDADTLAAPNYLGVINKVTDKGYDFGCALFKPENLHPVSILYSILAWGSGFVMKDAGGNMYVRREFFDKVKGFDPKLIKGQDTNFSRRVKAKGAKYKFLHSTHVVTSMRKFKQNGYWKELFVNQMWPYLKSMTSKRK